MTYKHLNPFLIALLALILKPNFSQADIALGQKLSGRILLQVESKGEAWYVNPANQNRYYMGRPDDAFGLMRSLGIGITDSDLKKIPVGLLDSNGTDTDKDGLSDALENALNSDPNNTDSDGDNHDDKTELTNNYDLSGTGKIAIDRNFTSQNAGKIFLQVQKNGEAWYVNPVDGKRYFLSRPHIAFEVMRNMGLGITDTDLNQIIAFNPIPTNTIPKPAPAETFYLAATAFRNDDPAAVDYFTPEMKSSVQYTLDFLDNEGAFNLGNIMAGAELTSSTDTEKIYSTTISFSGYTKTITFRVVKQADGNWLVANL